MSATATGRPAGTIGHQPGKPRAGKSASPKSPPRKPGGKTGGTSGIPKAGGAAPADTSPTSKKKKGEYECADRRRTAGAVRWVLGAAGGRWVQLEAVRHV